MDSPLLQLLFRRPHLLLGVLMLELFGACYLIRGGVDDWQFFSWGSAMLFGQHEPFIRPQYDVDGSAPGGLHTYANYPFLQIGPPALLVARFTGIGPGDGRALAMLIIGVLGLLSLYCVDRACRLDARRQPSAALVLVGGLLAVVVWAPLLRSGHLDDALALTGFAAAAWALRAHQPVATGLCLGLAAAAKPWAVVLLPLVLVLPLARQRFVAAGTALAVIAVSWGPFVLADRDTVRLGDQGRVLGPGTSLEVLGWLPATQTLRLTQLGVGAALVALLVFRGRWELAALAAFSLRLLLEVNALGYYSAGLVLAALLADVAAGRRWPVLTAVVAAVSVLAGAAGDQAGTVRLLLYVGLLLLTMIVAARGAPRGRVLVPA